MSTFTLASQPACQTPATGATPPPPLTDNTETANFQLDIQIHGVLVIVWKQLFTGQV